MLPQRNLDRRGSPRRAFPASASCSPHPFLPSSPYLLFIIPFLRDYILLMWDEATRTFHIPSEFLRTSQVTTAFLITSNAQPSCISCTLKVFSSFSSGWFFSHAIDHPPAPRESQHCYCDVMWQITIVVPVFQQRKIFPHVQPAQSMQSFIHHKQ